jgi:hypothetical protein
MKFDTYTIKARALPFLILVIPAITLLVSFYSIEIDIWIAKYSVPLSLLLFVIGILVRKRGAAIQPKLWKEWGGAPTTRYLRHSNREYNSISRNLCHLFFIKNINGINMPTAEEELENPERSDEVYRACIQYLLKMSYDKKKYSLIYAENIEYGFFRNCLGLKPFGIIFCCISAYVNSILIWYYWGDMQMTNNLIILLGVTIGCLLFWVLAITKKSVKSSSEAYAERLLTICFEN